MESSTTDIMGLNRRKNVLSLLNLLRFLFLMSSSLVNTLFLSNFSCCFQYFIKKYGKWNKEE